MCTRVCIASHIACGGDFLHVGVIFLHMPWTIVLTVCSEMHMYTDILSRPLPPRILHARELRKLPSANARPRNKKKSFQCIK